MEIDQLKKIVEAALLAAEQPLSLNQLSALFVEDAAPSHAELKAALEALDADCADRGIELTQVASGYRLQVRQEMQQWISRLWSERRPRYSRALLETLAIIAYRQPMTRGEIEEIRGVSVSSNIMRTLQEREWVRIVGHRDVPGRPALFGTTRRFLDYFSLTSLDKLPTLAEIRDLDDIEPELALPEPGEMGQSRNRDGSSDANRAETEGVEHVEETDEADSEAPEHGGETDQADDEAAEHAGEIDQADPEAAEHTGEPIQAEAAEHAAETEESEETEVDDQAEAAPGGKVHESSG